MFLELTRDHGTTSESLAEATFDESARQITLQAQFAALNFDDVAGFVRLCRTTFYPGLANEDAGSV